MRKDDEGARRRVCKMNISTKGAKTNIMLKHLWARYGLKFQECHVFDNPANHSNQAAAHLSMLARVNILWIKIAPRRQIFFWLRKTKFKQMLFKYSLSSFILDDDRLLLQLALSLQPDAWLAHHARSQQNPFTMAKGGNTKVTVQSQKLWWKICTLL